MRTRSSSTFIGILLSCAALHPARGVPQSRQLSFAERVAYQYPIEEVYWRHRIWPNENASRKPSLDTVMTQQQIEKKVADYLRDSQAAWLDA